MDEQNGEVVNAQPALTAEEMAVALETRWNDPAQIVAHGYHLVMALKERAGELERRWNDPAALRARLGELAET